MGLLSSSLGVASHNTTTQLGTQNKKKAPGVPNMQGQKIMPRANVETFPPQPLSPSMQRPSAMPSSLPMRPPMPQQEIPTAAENNHLAGLLGLPPQGLPVKPDAMRDVLPPGLSPGGYGPRGQRRYLDSTEMTQNPLGAILHGLLGGNEHKLVRPAPVPSAEGTAPMVPRANVETFPAQSIDAAPATGQVGTLERLQEINRRMAEGQPVLAPQGINSELDRTVADALAQGRNDYERTPEGQQVKWGGRVNDLNSAAHDSVQQQLDATAAKAAAARSGRPGWNPEYRGMQHSNNPRTFDPTSRQPDGYTDTGIAGGLVSPFYAMNEQQRAAAEQFRVKQMDRDATRNALRQRLLNDPNTPVEPGYEQELKDSIGRMDAARQKRADYLAGPEYAQRQGELDSRRANVIAKSKAEMEGRQARLEARKQGPNPMMMQMLRNPQLAAYMMNKQSEAALKNRELDIEQEYKRGIISGGKVMTPMERETAIQSLMTSGGLTRSQAEDAVARSSGAGMNGAPGASTIPKFNGGALPLDLTGIDDNEELVVRAREQGYDEESINAMLRSRSGRGSASTYRPDGTGFWDVATEPFWSDNFGKRWDEWWNRK